MREDLSIMSEITAIFEEGGPLGGVPGYRVRRGQVCMAAAVAEAVAKGRNLIVEAGTGTGKTFGYLIPILKKGYKAIVSTEAKNLQNQISEKDLPALLKLMGLEGKVKTVVWKGKSNYVCREVLEGLMNRAERRKSHEGASGDALDIIIKHKSRVAEFIRAPGNGELSDFEKITGISSSKVLPRIAIDGERCLGDHCKHCDDCYHKLIRVRAQQADVVIVNHSLLCYGAFWEDYLPDAEAVVIDEAHKFPDTLKQCFSVRFNSITFLKTLDRVREHIRDALGGEKELKKLEEGSLKRSRKDSRGGDGEINLFTADRLDSFFSAIPEIKQALNNLEETLPGFNEVLRSRYTDPANDYSPLPEFRGRERDLPVVFSRSSQEMNKCMESGFLEELDDLARGFYPVLKDFLEQLDNAVKIISNAANKAAEKALMAGPDSPEADFSAHMARSADLLSSYSAILKEKIFPELSPEAELAEDDKPPFDSENYYRSYVRTPGHFEISATPYNPDREFREYFSESKINLKHARYIFTSATISTGGMSSFDGISESGNYNYFTDFLMRLGLDNTSSDVMQIASPFNYYRNSLLCIPEGLNGLKKAPGTGQIRPDAILEMLADAINITPGGIFILCTSYAAVSAYYAAMYQLIKTQRIRSRLLMYQGDDSQSKEQMTARFRENGRAILIGTKSFWEGVDMPGKDLSMVIIDKIPFPQMSIDLKAERKYCEAHRNPASGYGVFELVDMPRAIIDLKQGAGRLIRKEDDTGVVVICSPALTDGGRKQYRDDILESLPPMYFDTEVSTIREFWNWHRKHDKPEASS